MLFNSHWNLLELTGILAQSEITFQYRKIQKSYRVNHQH